MDNLNHIIHIDNLQSGEAINYPIVQIRGHVVNKAKCCSNDKIVIVNSLAFEIISYKFKALAELKIGENSIKICYGCSSTSIVLFYKENETIFSVLPLYIICAGHDGCFQTPHFEDNSPEIACRKINLGAKLLQSILGEKLYEQNLGRKSFRLRDDCIIFNSKLDYLEARKLNQQELWYKLGHEICNSALGREENKFLAFLSCTYYRCEDYAAESVKSHEDIVKLTDGYIALGGGGLALFHTACLYTWPESLGEVVGRFKDDTLIDPRYSMDDSCYGGTIRACFSATLGAVLHELCHTFDLGHTDKGIMGQGYNNIHKVFINETGTAVKVPGRFQRNFECKEEFDSEPVSNAKKYYRFNKNDICDNDSFFNKSCAVFLSYHRWFNTFNSSSSKIKLDIGLRLLSSTAGLRVVELRNEENGMVLESWTFLGRVLKYSFQIPDESIIHLMKQKILIAVEDNLGNILKEPYVPPLL